MKRSNIERRIWEAVLREFLLLLEDDESVLEKKTRDVSSIGWKIIRATREPDRLINCVKAEEAGGRTIVGGQSISTLIGQRAQVGNKKFVALG